MNAEAAFNLLDPEVRRVIYSKGWTTLRPIQVDAIQAFFANAQDLLLVAATAAGKTEAWALPALTMLSTRPQPSVQAVCICPLKGLINDQFKRLLALCQPLGIAVHRWHGDVEQNHKQALRKNPSGILIITPESVEAMLMNRAGEIPALFKHLELVIIDEVHALMSEERGIHLQSLLSRMFYLIGHRPRHFGLSATIGNVKVAREFLNFDQPDTVQVLHQDHDDREMRIRINAYVYENEK
jgi:ATP-dependent helicase Lhr and Lhr-like helicase